MPHPTQFRKATGLVGCSRRAPPSSRKSRKKSRFSPPRSLVSADPHAQTRNGAPIYDVEHNLQPRVTTVLCRGPACACFDAGSRSFPVGSRSFSCRFVVGYPSVLGRFPVGSMSIPRRFPIGSLPPQSLKTHPVLSKTAFAPPTRSKTTFFPTITPPGSSPKTPPPASSHPV
jgi:hypothetical protein